MATEIDGKEFCDNCGSVDEPTTPIVVDFGEIELCKACLTEEATRADANAAAAEKWDRDIDPTSHPERGSQRPEKTDR